MKCRICKNTGNNQSFMTREMMYGYRDSFEYFQCSKCDCLQISNYPTNIDKYYKANYYSYGVRPRYSLKEYLIGKRNKFEITRKGVIGRLVSKIKPEVCLKLLFSNLYQLMSADKNISILDVGCGWGHFLRLLEQVGYKNLTGVDPFIDKDIIVNDNFTIFKRKIDEMQGKYDLIFLNHSLEHMPNQGEAIKVIANLLSDTGLCVIRIPVSSSFAWRHFGVNWVQLDSPRHFYLHSETSLKLIAEAGGLVVIRVVYDSTSFQYIGSEQYAKDIPKMSSESQALNISRKQRDEYDRMAIELNSKHEGDQAIFFMKHEKSVN